MCEILKDLFRKLTFSIAAILQTPYYPHGSLLPVGNLPVGERAVGQGLHAGGVKEAKREIKANPFVPYCAKRHTPDNLAHYLGSIQVGSKTTICI